MWPVGDACSFVSGFASRLRYDKRRHVGYTSVTGRIFPEDPLAVPGRFGPVIRLARQSRGDFVRDSTRKQFNALVLPHLAVLYRVAYRLVRNTADAQDLVQDTCVAACQHLPELAAAESPRRWLLRVQQNRFIDGVRRNRGSPIVAAGDPEEQAPQPGELLDPSLLLQQSQSEQLLEQAFLRLDEMQRTLLGLRIEGYDLPEIEAITGIDRNVLSKRLLRARRSLARHLLELNGSKP
jgi:RNA polymerase sigma factor (sigma-70 family)